MREGGEEEEQEEGGGDGVLLPADRWCGGLRSRMLSMA